MKKERREAKSERLAAAQFGVISRSQALSMGMSERMIDHRVRTGAWERILTRVYRVGHTQESWRQLLMAALLSAPEGSAVSHRAAAVLLGLEGVDEAPAELTVPMHRTPSGSNIVIHRTDTLIAADLEERDGFLLTNATRTLIDLGAVVEPEVVEAALEDALRKGLTSLPRLRWRLRTLGRRGRRGAGVLRGILEARGNAAPTESALETKVARLLARAKLPVPIRQFEVCNNGRLIARVDFAYPDQKVAIECDGYRFHSGRGPWDRDRQRRNTLGALGWLILHVTWEDVRTRPHEVIEEIRATLKARSERSFFR